MDAAVPRPGAIRQPLGLCAPAHAGTSAERRRGGCSALARVATVSTLAGAALSRATHRAPPACPPAAVAAPVPLPPPRLEGTEAAAVSVRSCATAQHTVQVPDGALLDIAPGIIASVHSARYGGGGQLRDVEGLLDAYTHRGGLRLLVDPDTLGGAPLPRGRNALNVTVRCGGPAQQRSLLPPPDAEWQRAQTRPLPDGPGACGRQRAARRGPDLPQGAPAGGRCADAAACSAVYRAVQEYAAGQGTLPASAADAVACSLSFVNPRQSVAAMAAEARRRHGVWAVRILPSGTVEWAPQGRRESWLNELESYSILQLHIAVLEEALRGVVLAAPLYLLLNALDKPGAPLKRRRADTPAECNSTAVLRRVHQADCVPGAEWMDKWTQWGGEALRFLPFPSSAAAPPVLSWSIVPGWNADILAPNRHPGSCHHFFRAAGISAVRWAEKEDRLLMRAFSLACDPQSNGPRQKLVCWAESLQKEGGYITLGGRRIHVDIGGGRGYGPTGSQKYMSPARQARAKYVLLLDGVVAAFRSTWLLQTGSVIFATGAWLDVRTQLLLPWVHYVPFSSDLSDLTAALSVVAANDTFASWIAGNAQRAAAALSGEPADGGDTFDALYYGALVRGMAQRLTFNTSGAERIQWSSNRQCASWRRTTGRVRQCLPDSYACRGSPPGPPAPPPFIHAKYFQGNG
eukprot:TRINITY_DN26890_c0_g1_i2.p1 TRINITY_DN26890_c0_g1~~TRINITY_DN26890_c0_g1_i2.p1  ORF type:complete len:712 (+),score=126.07 TRINITY_DN26890_c0_g1_i2:73-2136(+)